MHILFLTDNFPPEGNAPATRTYEHAREWVKKGVQVTIITGAPNFPEGVVFKGYSNKWLHKENIDGITVWRVKTYITANEGFVKRTLDFISFMLSSFLFGLFTKKVDVVVGTSPQFFTAISAWALAKLKRVPFVFELRDIWPASITAVGAMKKSKLISILEKIELFLYKQASSIISVTNSFKSELIERGVEPNKIKVVLNGVDLSSFASQTDKDQEFVDTYSLNGKFIAGYIGTHGLAHSLDNIVKAAELLQAEDGIKFVFAGGGADRVRIEELVVKNNLSNIVMIPRQDKSNMPSLWSICDVSLVHLKNTPLFKTVIPSKIFESMGMGLPIIMSVPEGESTKIVSDNNAGVIIPPENPSALAQAVLSLSKDKDKLAKLREGSAKAAKKFDRVVQANTMLTHIEETVRTNS
ncbi:putative teichuronic acid biosynthesis glycosyltransferase TuaH [Pseudoalteromonas sp. P1-30]|jgi:glycosyltransferase involved in cell wall biosynthesis|uniref:glycosyltransferase family 4 protein n=1 Tax=Pseudoalteromonas sp. P1-30 TaxID=1723760 RepID=UPI0006D63D6E|nr:glycosyltransferase family 4 protein [Pseudoalteromonas sp. P1-30]KPV91522.1 putative teichuronic acid biosynthesis glycosyltransferase TuaH [Pseudoalteromonas sp. P1-30]